MTDLEDESEFGIEDCLKILCIEQLCQWDVLIFLHRHHATLIGAEQIAHFLGYTAGAVTEALGRLDHLGLVRRSRAAQGIRLYEFSRPEDPRSDAVLDLLLGLSDDRAGRILMIEALRRHEGRPTITGPKPRGTGGRPWLRVN